MTADKGLMAMEGGAPGVRRLFPGSNTRRGFYSYFSYVWRPLPNPEPRRVWILKGGPGTGKSVFMRGIAEEVQARGYRVEWHHCAADPDSIDAVVFPDAGLALVDGTAPHALNPSLPGAVDEIIDLGRYWDSVPLRAARRRIEETRIRYRELYAVGYRYLEAAGIVHDEWRAAGSALQDEAKVNDVFWNMLQGWLRGRKAEKPGFVRRLFGHVVTPDGPRHHLDALAASARRVVVLRGGPDEAKSRLVGDWARALADHGVSLELFYCGLSPERPMHMLVPALDLAVVSSEPFHPLEGDGRGESTSGAPESLRGERVEVIHTDQLGRGSGGPPFIEERLREAESMFWRLLEQGLDGLKRARDLHDELEGVYGDAMDFAALDERRRLLAEEIHRLLDEGAAPR